eukprot:7271339-Pyramimonas_sp.AAC.1
MVVHQSFTGVGQAVTTREVDGPGLKVALLLSGVCVVEGGGPDQEVAHIRVLIVDFGDGKLHVLREGRAGDGVVVAEEETVRLRPRRAVIGLLIVRILAGNLGQVRGIRTVVRWLVRDELWGPNWRCWVNHRNRIHGPRNIRAQAEGLVAGVERADALLPCIAHNVVRPGRPLCATVTHTQSTRGCTQRITGSPRAEVIIRKPVPQAPDADGPFLRENGFGMSYNNSLGLFAIPSGSIVANTRSQ